MCTKRISVLFACVSVLALGLVSGLAGSAAAATMEDEATAMLAVYGSPGAQTPYELNAKKEVETTRPIGGGLGRNFGFGKNMLFQAGGGVGEALSITLPTEPATVYKAEESFIGGTLMSNKTGANNPLSFSIQFVDLQHGTLAGYSDTSDRPWMMEVCSPAAAENACKTDAQFAEPVKKGGVKIEDVSLNLNPGVVVQGWVWGEWINSPKEKEPPCVKLALPAAASPSLTVTQSNMAGITVGMKISAISGKACLISANNDWYPGKEPAVTIANT